LAFLPLLTSPPLTKIGIIYTQLLQEEKIYHLSNDFQIRLIEPAICTKMLKKMSEKLRAKVSTTTCDFSRVKIARLDDTFSEFFKLEASPVEGQSLQQRKGEKQKAEMAQMS